MWAKLDVFTFEQNPAINSGFSSPEGQQMQLLILGFLLQKVSTPDLLKPLAQESPKRATSPVLKQEDRLSSPAPTPLFSGGWRHVSL